MEAKSAANYDIERFAGSYEKDGSLNHVTIFLQFLHEPIVIF
jgi:hypothetical protein